MKHYIIWLKSGEVVQGMIDNWEKLNTRNPFILRFNDTEGTVHIKKSRIEAIAINDVATTNKCGF